MRDVADDLTELMASLEIGPVSESAAARAIARLDPVEAARALGLMIRHAKETERAAHALVVAARAIAFAPASAFPADARGRIREAAIRFGFPEVEALFAAEAPSREVDPAFTERPDPVIGSLTLGHKKMLARKEVDSDRIARFAMEPDPRVIRELLLNPRLTEESVVRIAARRPARTPVLMEIWRSSRWSVRRAVRRALAMNPYTPPEVALKIVPHLAAADLAAIAGDSALGPRVRELARSLARRPSIAAGGTLDQPADAVAEPGELAGGHDQDQHDGHEDQVVAGHVQAGHRKSD